MHLIYLAAVIESWKKTLTQFEEELISCEKEIERITKQRQRDDAPIRSYNQINSDLHALDSHCLRYGTELGTTVSVITALQKQHEEIAPLIGLSDPEMERTRTGFWRQLAEANALARIQAELAKKTSKTLEFVSERDEYLWMSSCLTI